MQEYSKANQLLCTRRRPVTKRNIFLRSVGNVSKSKIQSGKLGFTVIAIIPMDSASTPY